MTGVLLKSQVTLLLLLRMCCPVVLPVTTDAPGLPWLQLQPRASWQHLIVHEAQYICCWCCLVVSGGSYVSAAASLQLCAVVGTGLLFRVTGGTKTAELAIKAFIALQYSGFSK